MFIFTYICRFKNILTTKKKSLKTCHKKININVLNTDVRNVIR